MKLKMNGTLEEWWKILETDNANDIRKVLRRFVLKDRFLVALAMSYAKWHPANPKRGDAYCGLCEHFDMNCSVCPLELERIGGCAYDRHPWTHWVMRSTKKNADIMSEMVEKAYTAELKKRRFIR